LPHAFWLATLGGASVLRAPVGLLAPGYRFDAVLVDTASRLCRSCASESLRARQENKLEDDDAPVRAEPGTRVRFGQR